MEPPLRLEPRGFTVGGRLHGWDRRISARKQTGTMTQSLARGWGAGDTSEAPSKDHVIVLTDCNTTFSSRCIQMPTDTHTHTHTH